MIDIKKEYRTRDGKRVILFGGKSRWDEYPISGMICHEDGWSHEFWTENGEFWDPITLEGSHHRFDLFPVPEEKKDDSFIGLMSEIADRIKRIEELERCENLNV